MMHYTLRQLEVFLAVARTENISRACRDAVHVPVRGQRLSGDLEGHFDVKLFDRVGKRIQLNEFGKALRPKAQSLIEQANDLENALRQHSDIGRLQIGATLTIGNYLAVELMARSCDEQPGAQITLEVANTADIVHKVANFELDIALVEGELSHPDLDISVWHGGRVIDILCPDTSIRPKAATQRYGSAKCDMDFTRNRVWNPPDVRPCDARNTAESQCHARAATH